MEKALVCVFFAATESSSEAFDSSWSSGKPVVKVCHCNTQVTCDFLTHLVVSEFVDAFDFSRISKVEFCVA